MTSNGGTLHGVPQNPGGHHSCSQCGLLFDSAASLQVHMHYHHDSINRWGPPGSSTIIPPPPSSISNSSASPTDSENNNQPATKLLLLQRIKSESSPQSNTIAAAADSSDNQPPTPQPISGDPGTPQSYSGTSSPYQQISHPPPQELHYAYMHNYEQYYHPHNAMDYGVPPPPHHLNNNHHQQQQEYKPVPSSRYHPYMHNNNNSNSSSHQNSPSVTQSSLSPSVVSSSSPTTTTSSSVAPPQSQIQIPPGQPTPSPSPKQCDKCGLVCETAGQLSEHCATAHPNFQSNENGNNLNRSNDDNSDMPIMNFGTTISVKEEQPSDILDLDSQKMVYPPHHDNITEGSLPPMNSLHSIHPLQRPPMSWGHDPHAFMPPHHQQDLKLSYYSQTMPTIKQEFPPIIKSEYSHSIPTLMQPESKQFQTDVTSANQVTTSPSDFPTTTTPQDNGTQFNRTFEPTSSSASSNSGQMKSTTWKSNEARRPKTYNCTACNKWFTSSGHLKRHYNTTLHKNAVKSSGQPDPATLPISAHHHPSRDPNSKHSRRANAAQQQSQPPPPPPEPPSRSPEYTPQYTPPSGFGPPQPLPTGQGFQQYGTTLHSTTSGGPPNGVAGPSVHASQSRGLQIYMNNNLATQQQLEVLHQGQTHIITSATIPQQHQHTTHHQSQHQQLINITNTMDLYNTINPININTTTHSYQDIQVPEELQQSYHHITGNQADTTMSCDSSVNDHNFHQHAVHQQQPQPHQHMQQQHQQQQQHYDDGIDQMETDDKNAIKLSVQTMMINRLSGGAAMYQGDTAPPFSPDIPEPYTSSSTMQNLYSQDGRSPTPQMGETAPHSPSSPSVTSSQTIVMNQTVYVITEVPTSNNNEPYRCIQCDKVFNKSCYLTQHNKTFHSGEKPFKCQRCGKRFPCDQSHEEHVAKHAGEKPFKCELCPKQFNHKTDLRRHMCVHSGAKPYACELCGKGFIRKDHMIKHIETHRRKSEQLKTFKVKIKKLDNKVKTLKNTKLNYNDGRNGKENGGDNDGGGGGGGDGGVIIYNDDDTTQSSLSAIMVGT